MLADKDRRVLIELAWQSIQHGLDTGSPLTKLGSIEAELSPALRAPGASFVTLEWGNDLRGCIGSLEAHRPLAEDVTRNAFAAAFRDPRFPPLQQQELAGLTLQVSVLTPPAALVFENEMDLLRQLVPGEDGIILQAGQHRATFLPQVWEQLPAPQVFMAHLKQKAGLPADYWSNSLEVQRYHVEKFG